MKRNPLCALFVALALVLCLIPSLGLLAGIPQESGANEVLAPMPELKDAQGNWNVDYLSRLREYAQDHFFLRPAMISAWSELNTRLLRTPIADNVVLGSDGWLYFGDTMDDYTGVDPLEDGEIYMAAHNLALVQEYCREQGADFLFTSVPNKNTLYPEHMPKRTVFSETRNLPRLQAELERQGVAYLDMESVFKAEDETLYFTQDSHWNSKGAALGADAINAALGRSSHYYEGSFHPEPIHRSDLYDMLYPTGTWLEDDMVYEGELNISYDKSIRSPEDQSIMTASEGKPDSLLMFRDSFGNLLYPYMADSFGRALFSRSNSYLLGMIQARSATHVVVELVERNIPYLLQYVPQMPAPVREAPADAPDPALRDAVVTMTAGEPGMVGGCVELRGSMDIQREEGSQILLQTPDGACYEAFQLENGGFGLYAPESVLTAEDLTVLFRVDGVQCSAIGEIISQQPEEGGNQ